MWSPTSSANCHHPARTGCFPKTPAPEQFFQPGPGDQSWGNHNWLRLRGFGFTLHGACKPCRLSCFWALWRGLQPGQGAVKKNGQRATKQDASFVFQRVCPAAPGAWRRREERGAPPRSQSRPPQERMSRPRKLCEFVLPRWAVSQCISLVTHSSKKRAPEGSWHGVGARNSAVLNYTWPNRLGLGPPETALSAAETFSDKVLFFCRVCCLSCRSLIYSCRRVNYSCRGKGTLSIIYIYSLYIEL